MPDENTANVATYKNIIGAAEGDSIAHLGDQAQELQTARKGSLVAPLPQFCLLDCSGADARQFLHNQLTCDVRHLQPGKAAYAGWCNAKGRLLATFMIWQNQQEQPSTECEQFLLLASHDLLASVLKRMRMFVLRARVELNDLTENCRSFGLSGQQASALLQTSADSGLPTTPLGVWQGNISINGAHWSSLLLRLGPDRWQMLLDSSEAATAWQALSQELTPTGTNAWRWLEIEAGIPWVSSATSEAFVPQMTDLEKIGGVSFHKGCYPGQEVVARAQHLGKVKRHLYWLDSNSPLTAGDEIITSGDSTTLQAKQTDSSAEAMPSAGLVIDSAPSPDGGYRALAVLHESLAKDNITLRMHNGAGVQPHATPVYKQD